MVRRLSLGALLSAFSLGMVIIAIACVGVAGVQLLQRLADDQAVARVRLAAVGAAQALDRTGERLEISADLLAERPTLVRYVQERDQQAAAEFLTRFAKTGNLAGCAVIRAGRVFAHGGEEISWEDIPGLRPAQEGRSLVARAGPEPLLLAAWAPLGSMSDAEVCVVRILDVTYATRTGGKVGLPVRILEREEISQAAGNPRGLLQWEAFESGNPAARRIDAEGLFVAAAPLFADGSLPVGIVEASLPTGVVDSSLAELGRTLLLLIIVVGVLATIFSFYLARRLVNPIGRLTRAAARIGQGDLATPVPRAGGAEVETLAAAMEEMRSRVLQLTTELRQKQAEAEAILTGIVEGVFAVDRERRIRYLNPQAAALLGISSQEALGRFCGDVLNPRGPSGERPCEESCPILHARFRGRARAAENLELKDRTRRSVVITSAPAVHDAGAGGHGNSLQFQVIRDETETEATHRLRDAVLANISHEFRTPLTAQLASLELLRDRLPELSATEVGELVLSLERGALRLTRLIDNLLESTRIEAGQDALRRQDVALDEVVEEAIGLVAPLIEQRRQRLSVDLPYPLPSVTGDAPRLTQVFVNLLSNANKFGPEETEIRVGGEVREREIRLWVEDEGPGMPGGGTDFVFERYRRSPAGEPVESGMGLGLFVVKSIVTRHGGRVEARDREPGARVTVILPRKDGDATSRVASERSEAS
jgi:signal transduction histidine kinase